jgi:GNAT superfamily N-acetyltransferase
LSYSIRKATLEDLPAVIDLAVDMVLFSISPLRDFRSDAVRRYRRADLQALEEVMCSDQASVLIAEQDGKLIGHVIVATRSQESSSGTSQAWVFDLSVRPDHWGTGLSQALMARAEAFGRELGMSHIGLGVTLSNERALRFYQRLGYQEERVQMVKRL